MEMKFHRHDADLDRILYLDGLAQLARKFRPCFNLADLKDAWAREDKLWLDALFTSWNPLYRGWRFWHFSRYRRIQKTSNTQFGFMDALIYLLSDYSRIMRYEERLSAYDAQLAETSDCLLERTKTEAVHKPALAAYRSAVLDARKVLDDIILMDCQIAKTYGTELIILGAKMLNLAFSERFKHWLSLLNLEIYFGELSNSKEVLQAIELRSRLGLIQIPKPDTFLCQIDQQHAAISRFLVERAASLQPLKEQYDTAIVQLQRESHYYG